MEHKKTSILITSTTLNIGIKNKEEEKNLKRAYTEKAFNDNLMDNCNIIYLLNDSEQSIIIEELLETREKFKNINIKIIYTTNSHYKALAKKLKDEMCVKSNLITTEFYKKYLKGIDTVMLFNFNNVFTAKINKFIEMTNKKRKLHKVAFIYDGAKNTNLSKFVKWNVNFTKELKSTKHLFEISYKGSVNFHEGAIRIVDDDNVLNDTKKIKEEIKEKSKKNLNIIDIGYLNKIDIEKIKLSSNKVYFSDEEYCTYEFKNDVIEIYIKVESLVNIFNTDDEFEKALSKIIKLKNKNLTNSLNYGFYYIIGSGVILLYKQGVIKF